MSTPSQLHNPKAVWFLGAPVSKAIAASTAAIYVLAEMNKWHEALVFDTSKIFDQAQFYRIFVCNLTFASIGELVFGLLALCPLMRRFEREMGSRKFGAFIIYSSVLSTIFELVFFNIFFDTERYSGPYPQLGAVLAMYHKFAPRLHPKFFGVLGYDFSEKSLTYGLCAQVILSGGLSTAIPTIFGFISGMLSVSLSQHELPEIVYTAAGTLGKAFVDDAPAIMMARTVQRGGRNQQRRASTGARGGRDATAGAPAAALPAVQPPRPPQPPPEEAIAMLSSMGFDRDAVIRALQQADNNVEAAANRLLMG
ncbi:predicted protein [Thalassiosira pseudonana CCMP1335]|uniref:UBA domain-containing protein n=1 Tax=Thalassiosira pseudonana TaxID=35128 RepID=B8C4J5_THAPS|nr:predicted protein [Thalassiosira pseudonana CCMP1335]EED91735.1 predicted protein [Thalassiosira pseudonana CCMP1335]